MKCRNLMKLGRRKRSQPQTEWLQAMLSAQPRQKTESELLQIPFHRWCETLKIKTPYGLAPFELFDWQKKTAELIVGEAAASGRQIVVLSSRQTGKTSMFLALAGYLAQARAHFTGVLVHRTGTDAGLLARRLKRFLSGVQPDPDNLSLMGFESGAFLHFRSSNPKRGAEGAEATGRGLESVDICIVEEAGHTGNLQDVLGVIGPAMTFGSPRISVLIGTAGSKESHYYRLLAESAGGEKSLDSLLEGIRNGTKEPFQILNREGTGPIGVISNWRCIPQFAAEDDFLGRVQRELNIADAQMDSEYEMIFSSGIDSAVFEFNTVIAAEAPKIRPYEDDSELIYVGIDPSAQGKDYAASIALREVRRGRTILYEVVDIYRKRTGTAEQHLRHVAKQMRKLSPICATVESNSIGQVWLENLAGLNLDCKIEGFQTTQPSKAVLIGRLQIALEMGVLRIPKDSAITEELLAFRRLENGKMEASGKSHDDCVIALALALHASRFRQETDD